MERNIRELFVLTIFFVLASLSQGNVDFACCPPKSYIFNNTCLDVQTNDVTALNIDTCKMIGTSSKNFTINSDKLELKYSPKLDPLFFEPYKACFGNEIKDKSNLQNASRVVKLCNNRKDNNQNDNAFVYCLLVSSVFLVLVVIIYSSYKELRDLFGWSVINYCASLAIGLAIFSLLRIVTPTLDTMGFCAAQGFLAYFFVMASFFWLNSISIQVFRDTRRPPVPGHGWCELKYYLAYSWGTPALLTVIMVIVNYYPGDHQRPGIGHNHCWFITLTQQWYYMFSEMIILLLINLAIFIYVVTIIWRLSFSSTPVVAVKFKLWLMVKLIILMGLPWILFMIEITTGVSGIPILIVDIVLGLQGVLIFAVLVLRKRVVKELHRSGVLCACAGAVERWLGRSDDAETRVVQHTDLPLQDNQLNYGNLNQ